MDNGSQNNLVSQDQVQRVQIPTMPHPSTYQICWVQKGGPRLIVFWCYAVTFTIGPFKDGVRYNLSPLICVEFLLRLPYQHARKVVCHAKYHQYHLKLIRCTYVLTSSRLKSTQHITDQASLNQVSRKQCVSLCFLHPIDPNNQNNHVPPSMAPSLEEFSDVFTQPTIPPSYHSMYVASISCTH